MPNRKRSQPAANAASEAEQLIILELTRTDAWILWTQLRLALDQPFNAEGRHVCRIGSYIHELEEQLFGPLFTEVEDPWFEPFEDQTP